MKEMEEECLSGKYEELPEEMNGDDLEEYSEYSKSTNSIDDKVQVQWDNMMEDEEPKTAASVLKFVGKRLVKSVLHKRATGEHNITLKSLWWVSLAGLARPARAKNTLVERDWKRMKKAVVRYCKNLGIPLERGNIFTLFRSHLAHIIYCSPRSHATHLEFVLFLSLQASGLRKGEMIVLILVDVFVGAGGGKKIGGMFEVIVNCTCIKNARKTVIVPKPLVGYLVPPSEHLAIVTAPDPVTAINNLFIARYDCTLEEFTAPGISGKELRDEIGSEHLFSYDLDYIGSLLKPRAVASGLPSSYNYPAHSSVRRGVGETSHGKTITGEGERRTEHTIT